MCGSGIRASLTGLDVLLTIRMVQVKGLWRVIGVVGVVKEIFRPVVDGLGAGCGVLVRVVGREVSSRRLVGRWCRWIG